LIKVLKLNYSIWCTQTELLSNQLISKKVVFANADLNSGTVSNGAVTLQQINFAHKNDLNMPFLQEL
jgi:hypothetical protein